MSKHTPAAQIWLTILRPHLPRIEARLVQWVAQGRLHQKKKPMDPNAAPLIQVLKQAVTTANGKLKVAAAQMSTAECERDAAAAALQQQIESAPKGKKGAPPEEDPTLRAALDACDRAVSACRPDFERAQKVMATAKDAFECEERKVTIRLNRARLEAVAEGKWQKAATEHKLRTGQALRCDVPHLVEGARRLATDRPGELLLSMGALRALLLELRIPFDGGSLRILLTYLNRKAEEERQEELQRRRARAGMPTARPASAVRPAASLSGAAAVQLARARPTSAPVTLRQGHGVGHPSLTTPPNRKDLFHSFRVPPEWWQPREAVPALRPVSLHTLRKAILEAGQI